MKMSGKPKRKQIGELHFEDTGWDEASASSTSWIQQQGKFAQRILDRPFMRQPAQLDL